MSRWDPGETAFGRSGRKTRLRKYSMENKAEQEGPAREPGTDIFDTVYCDRCGDAAFYVKASKDLSEGYRTVRLDGDAICVDCFGDLTYTAHERGEKLVLF